MDFELFTSPNYGVINFVFSSTKIQLYSNSLNIIDFELAKICHTSAVKEDTCVVCIRPPICRSRCTVEFREKKMFYSIQCNYIYEVFLSTSNTVAIIKIV